MEYKTKNFYLSTTLETMGVDFLRLEKDIDSFKKEFVFVFDVSNIEIENIIEDYDKNKILVEPKLLFRVFKKFKERMNNYSIDKNTMRYVKVGDKYIIDKKS